MGAKLPRDSGTADADCCTVTVDDDWPPPELALALVVVLDEELDFFPLPPHPATTNAIATNATAIKPEARWPTSALLSKGLKGIRNLPVRACPKRFIPAAVAGVNRSFG